MNDEEFELIESDVVDNNVQTDFWWRCVRSNWDEHR